MDTPMLIFATLTLLLESKTFTVKFLSMLLALLTCLLMAMATTQRVCLLANHTRITILP